MGTFWKFRLVQMAKMCYNTCGRHQAGSPAATALNIFAGDQRQTERFRAYVFAIGCLLFLHIFNLQYL